MYLQHFFRVFVGILFTCGALLAQARSSKPKSVCISQIIEHPALNATRRGIIDELAASGYNVPQTLTLRTESAQGIPSLALQIAQNFVGEHPDAIVALGTSAAQPFIKFNRTSIKPTPVIFSSVTDPVGAGILPSLQSGNLNMNGVSNFIALQPQFRFFKHILNKQATVLKLGVIYNPGEANSVKMLESMQRMEAECGVQIIPQAATNAIEVSAATAQLISLVDAFFITNDNTALAAFSSITKLALKFRVPVFTSDVDLVEQDALAAMGPDQYELGRQTGRLLVQVLNKTVNLDQLPVAFPLKDSIRINPKIVKALNIQLDPELLELSQQTSK